MHHRSALWVFVVALLRLQECLADVRVEVYPQEAVVLPGDNVTYMCRVGVAIQYCRVEIPGLPALNLNNQQRPTSGVAYYGSGLEAGQCGFTIDKVEDKHNGQIKCSLGLTTQSQEGSGSMELTVARAPRMPEIELSRGTDALGVYKVNDQLQASCVVRDGRPVANISWFLEDEPLPDNELSMPSRITNIAKENLFTRVQNLTRILQVSDNGKLLRCVATHIALQNHQSIAQALLDVKFPPQPQGNPIDKFGYELGQPGIISVEIVANPKPQIEWKVREQYIKEGKVDSTGRIEAEAAKDLGKGHYLVNLHLAAITKQDTETQYTLTAYNDMGNQEYYIQISTSPEPEGLELGVGAIVGIVAAVLILLVIVFVIVFARVTGRWCFSGESRRTVAIGETSSDTESADVRPKESKKKLAPLKFTQLFKMNKDKVAHEDAEAKTIETEEAKTQQQQPEENDQEEGKKEGLVYAELDLVSQNLRPVVKNDDDKTEYAEIVYTPKEEGEGQRQQQQQQQKTGQT